MRRKAVIYLVLGLMLFVLSTPQLFAYAREFASGQTSEYRYDFRPIRTEIPGFGAYANEADYYGNRVELSDDFGDASAGLDAGEEEQWRTGQVRITINGEDYSHPAEAVIRPSYLDSNRYHGYLAIVELVDKRGEQDRLAVVQRIDGNHDSAWKEKLEWRLLMVSKNGAVEEEMFTYAERGEPLYRARLANYATPIAVGFHSDVLQAWPSLLYPLLYPFFTGLLGLLLLIMGAIGLRKEKKSGGLMIGASKRE